MGGLSIGESFGSLTLLYAPQFCGSHLNQQRLRFKHIANRLSVPVCGRSCYISLTQLNTKATYCGS